MPAVLEIDSELSVKNRTPGDVFAFFESMMHSMEQWCKDSDALIKQIKMALCSSNTELTLLSTGNGVISLGGTGMVSKDDDNYSFIFTAVVCGINEENLKEYVDEQIKSLQI